ncbi:MULTISPECIES: acylphosphatase [Luteimonas]|uniref:acylphosphatase n=1 Tax=Luteimonas TaxID=83614 RepID=UPI000C7DFCC1|nr:MULTISPECIES: acylphosphatase [Luteimonas]
MATARFRVSGRVQGVGFRAATRDQARRLQLRGHAANLDDGRVEVLVSGTPEAIGTLATWLAHGPPSAGVTRVVRDAPAVDAVPGDFEVC